MVKLPVDRIITSPCSDLEAVSGLGPGLIAQLVVIVVRLSNLLGDSEMYLSESLKE